MTVAPSPRSLFLAPRWRGRLRRGRRATIGKRASLDWLARALVIEVRCWRLGPRPGLSITRAIQATGPSAPVRGAEMHSFRSRGRRNNASPNWKRYRA